ncbi:MAG: radical SAM protein [Deltaproteobacteria bacterium]|nr:radical SAM protein [Deltaproteobacteria bacterium]
MPSIPRDCALLPLDEGKLLVSREHAVFGLVPAAEVAEVERLLRERLDRHGFFGSPRPPEDEPPLVQLQLTNDCNLACKYCCTDSGKPRGRELGFEQLCEIVEAARRLMGPKTRFAILGGEPLLSPHALPLARRINELGHPLTVFTNGTLLGDPNLAEPLAELSKRGVEVRISLAGVSQQSCDAVSGGARFESAVRGLEAFARVGGKAVVDLVLTPGNKDATARGLHALKQNLPEEFDLSVALLYLGGREQGDSLFGSSDELEQALDMVSFGAGERIDAVKTSEVAYRREACSCVLGNQISVRSDGALFTCFKMEEQVGHVERGGFDASLEWAMNNPQPATGYPLCKDCPLVTLCGGGCRTENKLLTGDGGTPVCGPWRVRVLSELLAEDKTESLDWPATHLLREAHARGIDAPDELGPREVSG